MTITSHGFVVKELYLFIYLDFKVSTSILSYLGDLSPYKKSDMAQSGL